MIDVSVNYGQDGSSVPFDVEATTTAVAIAEVLDYFNSDDASLDGSMQDFEHTLSFTSGAYDQYDVVTGHVKVMYDGVLSEKVEAVDIYIHTELDD